MMLIVTAMAFGHYKLVERQIRADALLLLEIQAREIAEAVGRQAQGPVATEELADYLDQHVDITSRQIPVHPDFEVLAAEGRVVEFDAGDRYPYQILIAPLLSGYAEIVIYSRHFLRGVRDVRNSFLQTLPIALLLSGLIGWWMARGSLASIARMTDAARRISASQLDEKIPTTGTGDELDSLARTLNAMMSRIRAGLERARSFSTNAAHQLRTPISHARSRLEIAAVSPRNPQADQTLIAAVLHDLERLGEAIRGMLRLADSEGGIRADRRRVVVLAPLVEEVLGFFEPLASERDVKLRLLSAAPATVSGDPDWLKELFSNLIDNALKYTPAGSSVEVAVRADRDRAAVSVRDHGPGIAAEARERVFERFYREEPASESGLGLGLTLAREIARAHDGDIVVEDAPGQGSTFTARLPLVAEPGETATR
jgi:two-component system heavy metal sensor histidine kinase CusS